MTKIQNIITFFCFTIGLVSSDDFTERCNQKIGTIVPGTGSIFGNTMDANSTFNLDLKLIPCGPTNEFFDLSNAGVFYSMMGTGAKIRITSCSTQAEFLSRVSAFTSCDSNSCVDSAAETKVEGGSNVTCFDEDLKAVLEFQSVPGVEYSLFVQDDNAGVSGDFAMFVEELPPDNALCTNSAPMLEIGKTYTGTTGGSVPSTTVPACNGTSSDGPGVWFAIPGEMDDTDVVLAVCSEQAFDFLVYTADCSALSCVDVKPRGESNLCEDGSIESRVEWIPNKGESYYVHMFGDSGANFRMAFGRPFFRKDGSGGSLSGKLAGGFVATTIARLVFAMFML